MMRAVLALISAACLLPAAARGNSDSDALFQFGLIGSWSFDCQAPPSPRNPYLNFALLHAGAPTRQVVTGKPEYDAVVPISDAAVVDDAHLRMSYPQGGVTITVTLLKEQRRIRPFEAVASDGTVSVSDGIAKSTGQATAWLTRCPDLP
jgi:hypothetical protein